MDGALYTDTVCLSVRWGPVPFPLWHTGLPLAECCDALTVSAGPRAARPADLLQAHV